MEGSINYPAGWERPVVLENGTSVTIRPIRGEDAPGLQAAFRKLTPESIYMRFLEVFRELSDEQAFYFANVDYRDRMAFVGTVEESGQESIVGVARYDLHVGTAPASAESAVIVRDDFQGLGLGKRLMLELVLYARQQGVQYLTGTIHSTNNKIFNFIKSSTLPYEREMTEPGVWAVRVDITGELPEVK